MYGIEKAVYLLLRVDDNKFRRLFRDTLSHVSIKYNPESTQRVHRKNEFIRIKRLEDNEDYMDFKIKSITLEEAYIIQLGQLIDTNKARRNEEH